MTIMATDMIRTNALLYGKRIETLREWGVERQFHVTTNRQGVTRIGPVRHRKYKGAPKAMKHDPHAHASTSTDSDVTKMLGSINASMRRAFPPAPVPPRSKWQRVKDRFTGTAWHHHIQHAAVDVLLWATAVTAVGLGARVLLWAWS